MDRRKLLLLQVAGLGHEFLLRHHGTGELEHIPIQPIDSVFPALTCPVQASVRTGLPPSGHGMIGNSCFDRRTGRPSFWEQDSRLVEGPRAWKPGHKVGMLFWQQSLGEEVDLLLSPAPIHKHGGGMVEAVYSRPEALYQELCATYGKPFRLSSYWGPLASAAGSRWIAAAVTRILERENDAPDLLLAYLPLLDYPLQKYGPDGPEAARAWHTLLPLLTGLLGTARRIGFEVVIFGDYALAPVSSAVFPNQALREAGLLPVRRVGRRLYPDFHYARAFAVADHEIAQVYCREPADVPAALSALSRLPGVGTLLHGESLSAAGVAHPSAGEIVALAAEGSWFAYPWWDSDCEAPDYASHVDIHNKPGYDPCELFLGWPPFTVSRNTSRIRGSHGRTGPGREVAFLSTRPPGFPVKSVLDLARILREHLEGA